MKITDLKCTVIEGQTLIRVETDEGISGLSQAQSFTTNMTSYVLSYKPFLLDMDPTNVERVMLRRHVTGRGSFGRPRGAGRRFESFAGSTG